MAKIAYDINRSELQREQQWALAPVLPKRHGSNWRKAKLFDTEQTRCAKNQVNDRTESVSSVEDDEAEMLNNCLLTHKQ